MKLPRAVSVRPLRLRAAVVALLLLVPRLAAVQEDEPSQDGKKLSEWVEQLKSQDAARRRAAIEAVGKFGPKGKEAVPALILAFRDSDDKVADAAVAALIAIGPDSVPPLLQ